MNPPKFRIALPREGGEHALLDRERHSRCDLIDTPPGFTLRKASVRPNFAQSEKILTKETEC